MGGGGKIGVTDAMDKKTDVAGAARATGARHDAKAQAQAQAPGTTRSGRYRRSRSREWGERGGSLDYWGVKWGCTDNTS